MALLEFSIVHNNTGKCTSSYSNCLFSNVFYNRGSQNVKRIVITSSTAAVFGSPSNPPTYTEADWNKNAVAEVREKGKDASNGAKYSASKTLDEQGEVLCKDIDESQYSQSDSCMGLL